MPEPRQKKIVLAGLAGAGQSATFSPVHTQKLFFIIDREISNLIGGSHFNFKPYDYGPFDKAVYDTLEELASEGLVLIQAPGQYNLYTITPSGYNMGQIHLQSFPPEARKFICDTAIWVRSLNFEQLVSAIYKKYPDMKGNSIFQS